jgi:hypothetical protein
VSASVIATEQGDGWPNSPPSVMSTTAVLWPTAGVALGYMTENIYNEKRKNEEEVRDWRDDDRNDLCVEGEEAILQPLLLPPPSPRSGLHRLRHVQDLPREPRIGTASCISPTLTHKHWHVSPRLSCRATAMSLSALASLDGLAETLTIESSRFAFYSSLSADCDRWEVCIALEGEGRWWSGAWVEGDVYAMVVSLFSYCQDAC